MTGPGASSPPDVAFLLGAGFNVDAARFTPSAGIQHPLVADLASRCFDGCVVADRVEEAFQDAIQAGYRKPLERLRELVMHADYKIVREMMRDMDNPSNPYLTFLRAFQTAPFITLNYDAFVELLLFQLGLWRPEDGFGVPVQADIRQPLVHAPNLPARSTTVVLHLHGSFHVYPLKFRVEQGPDDNIGWIKLEEDPLFKFDPYSSGHLVFPFEHQMPGHAYVHVEDRIIAPIPDKSTGLKEAFIQQVYARAKASARDCAVLVAIGYRFNSYDRASYDPIVRQMLGKPIVIVDPRANDLSEQLAAEYGTIEVIPQETTFSEWVQTSFAGLPR